MHTFILWLQKNVLAAQGALLQALVRRDWLRFVDAPKIQHEYMEKIGRFESEALEKELDATLLDKKKRLIQTCLNRREEVDLGKIDAQIAQEREELLRQAGLKQVTDKPRLSPEDEARLQEMYKELVKNFHPSVHPDLTDAQKSLFDKAVEAYQHQDLALLSVICEMLSGDQVSLPISVELGGEVDPVAEARKLAEVLTEDYTLSEKIFSFFSPLQEEKILQDTALNYHKQCKAVLQEIEEMLSKFPFAARDTLADEQKCEDYLKQIRNRIVHADARIAELQEAIADMTGANAHE